MRLIQYFQGGHRHVGVVQPDGNHAREIGKVSSVFEIANLAIARKIGIEALVNELVTDRLIDYADLLAKRQVMAPIEHPEPARFFITGTGLTHIGSASARNRMHIATHGDGAPESDSMKIFRMGLDGGKPEAGKIGIQPEWFYKGVGTCVLAPEEPIPLPAFALAGAEEAEIVGLYLVGPDGQPYRIGYALGNEFSDHITEAQNYLYTQHSKLRACSIGPEILIGELPQDVRGKSRIRRGDQILWEEDFLSGEKNMSHSIANLEHYHFRYPMFRRPGDLHAYFFGAAVMSYASGIKTQPGDVFEIEAEVFGKTLRNQMVAVPDEGLVTVKVL
ncbi:AraD1 family protein [Dongia sp.]|uniref:AraD1 family protein n=1 Tax=Dongia sp. TaxID=1977262 RepID=UPI0035B029B7